MIKVHSLVGLIAETDPRHYFKKFLLKILDDVIEKSISIEPPEEFENEDGVCHWCCEYNDFLNYLFNQSFLNFEKTIVFFFQNSKVHFFGIRTYNSCIAVSTMIFKLLI